MPLNPNIRQQSNFQLAGVETALMEGSQKMKYKKASEEKAKTSQPHLASEMSANILVSEEQFGKDIIMKCFHNGLFNGLCMYNPKIEESGN